MSPTSILDSKPLSGLKNPFRSETNSPRTPVGEHKRYWDKLDSKGLVDALVDDNRPGEVTSKSQSRMILFGSQLKIQNPPLSHPTVSPQSPKSMFGSANSTLEPSKSSRIFTLIFCLRCRARLLYGITGDSKRCHGCRKTWGPRGDVVGIHYLCRKNEIL
ncbi:uncharacterized protein HKW66_Vig0192630 [Vigna angularis]|uniref:Uncharacterized protein n=1 Tax=Phaseolus angularis TaxID=3914 RepID=A0A8T0KQI2_PHAAN|nr:uncharacterized protein HKW66_Vig0192630 [Vigna angularis]